MSFQDVRIIPTLFNIPLSHAHRNHRLIILPNGLTCLLMSDPSRDVAAAAMSVASGSHKDPLELPGLAHLCEHMLFMGTKEFPGAATYFDTIAKAGGTCNAFTSGVRSTFVLQIPITPIELQHDGEDSHNSVLANFASFFKCPKFDASYMERELEIIDNEHQSNVNNVDKVMYHGLRLLARPTSPFSRFCTGNLDTLKTQALKLKLPVRSLLVRHYEDNFVASNMRLVLMGPQSVNHLQKLAIAHFATVRTSTTIQQRVLFAHRHLSTHSDRRRSHRRSSCSTTRLTDASCNSGGNTSDDLTFDLCRVLHIRSNMATPRLRLCFPIEFAAIAPNCARRHVLRTYTKIWGALLGDESAGSLHQHFVQQGLTTSIYAYSLAPDHNTDCFIVEIGLTNRGARSGVRKVTQLLLSYIDNLDADELARYMVECCTIEKINFHFKAVLPELMDEAEELSAAHDDLQPSDIVQGYHWATGSQVDFTETTAAILTLANLNLIVLSETWDEGMCASLQVDPHFGFEYRLFPLWKVSTFNPCIGVPARNRFVCFTEDAIDAATRSLAMRSSDSDSPKYTTKDAFSILEPELLEFTSNTELWFKQDDLQASRAAVSTNIVLGALPTSCRSTLAIELICTLAGRRLVQRLYAAELVGYTWSILPNLNANNAISITVTGLADGIATVWREIMGTLEHIEQSLTYRELMASRIVVRKQYERIECSGPIDHIKAGMQILLERHVWSLHERLGLLEEMELKDLQAVAHCLTRLGERHTSTFVQGDLAPQDAFDLAQAVVGVNAATPGSHVAFNGSLLIPPGNFAVKEPAASDSQSNTVCVYIQIGTRESLLNRALAKTLSILWKATATVELRMKRNLGYSVYTGQQINTSTIGVFITVISGQHSCHHLSHQINDFLHCWLTDLQGNLTAADSCSYFEREILQPLLRNYDKLDVEGMGSPNTNYGLESVIGSGTKAAGDRFFQHKNLWGQIIDRTYRFGAVHGEEDVDPHCLIDLGPTQFLRHVMCTVLPNSPARASITIMLQSKQLADLVRKQVTDYISAKRLHHIYSASDLDTIALSHQPEIQMYKSAKANGARFTFMKKATRQALAAAMSAPTDTTFGDLEYVTVEQFHAKCT
jgi:protease AXL1